MLLRCIDKIIWKFSRNRHEIRESGDPQTSAETFARRQGACRDLAVAYIECCRTVGIAARFVSGYKCGFDRPGEDAYMHAWVEIFLPGAGWRGYDPSIGLAVADGHIALVSAFLYRCGTNRWCVFGI